MNTSKRSSLSARLGWPEPVGIPNRSTLERFFAWYVHLNIPYETISNLESNVLVRTAEEVVDSVLANFGGHCVEHGLLLVALLKENAFDARFTSADLTDHTIKRSTPMASTFALVRLGDEMIACEPYFTPVMLTVPPSGRFTQGRYAVERIDETHILFQVYRGDTLVAEELIHEDSTLEMRRQAFEERYQTFSPFGVITPYYQTRKPHRIAIYYAPQEDRFLVQDKQTYYIEEHDIARCSWIPEHIRVRIPEVAIRSRREREASIAFLRRGVFNPFYKAVETRRMQQQRAP